VIWAEQMTRSNKVKAVYEVLKDTAVGDQSTVDLLECAALLVRASEEGSVYEPEVDLNFGPPPMSELPLTTVFEHMSWKLINREIVWRDDFFVYQSHQDLLEQCLTCGA